MLAQPQRDAPAPPLRTVFSRNVDAITRARGLSRSELPRHAQCARSHVLDVLAGKHGVGIDRVARLAWALEVASADLLVIDMCPPLHVCTAHPEDLRRAVAASVRAWAFAAFGRLHVCAAAWAIGWHPSRVYAVLNCRVSLCIDKLATLSNALGTTAAALLCRAADAP